jgi:hypothetical protein
MSASQRVPTSVSQAGTGHSELDDLRATCWRLEQEIGSLNETIVVYRQGASALAGVIDSLRHELVAAHSLHTRTHTRGTQREVEITLDADEDAPAVVSLAVGEVLEHDHSANAVDAWKTVASALTEEAVLRHGTSTDVMLLLRLKYSSTAVAIEVLAA